jgi:hypothetical protein
MFDFTKPKWIIQDKQLRMGRVVNHFELAVNEGGDVKGGGLWYYDKETNSLYLYAKSYDFGQVSEDDFEDIWVRPSLEKSTIYFSTEMSLSDAKNNNVIVQDFDDENLGAN